MIWIILETEYLRETRIAREIANLGFETYNPMACRRHNRRGHISTKQYPLLPGYLFAHISPSAAPATLSLNYVIGAILDDLQRLYVIPDYQMANFMNAHQGWLEAQQRAWENGYRPRRKKFSEKFKLEAGDLTKLSMRLFGPSEAAMAFAPAISAY
jgi:hypothetical protein